jgi:ribosomal protein S18 acetylase RimI-like enzyme
LTAEDRDAVARIVTRVGNFTEAEINCALELVDIYLRDKEQEDYRLIVAEIQPGGIRGYACWGPTPLTRGTYDLYWIATDPASHGRGIGRALMSYVEDRVRERRARLLVTETSSRDSYVDTVRFYHRLGYEQVSRIPDFYDQGDDKLIFVKRFWI